ncbi:hypothetical protein LCGC14_2346280 [marine sediment metagenome]|uniref:Uncharacterized protein n=1 Tax=marine sediment metagenome TaxID=412755 RepID=A0A0F9CAG3_9ZZZZ
MDLDPSEKLLFLYLLTNSMTNIAGIYELPLKRISFDTGFDRDMVEKILERFHDDEKVLYKNGWVAIRNWPKHQSSSATVLEGIKRCLKDAPESMVPYVYPIGTLCKSAYIYSRVESSKKSYRENVAMTEEEHGKLVDNYGKAATEKGIVKLNLTEYDITVDRLGRNIKVTVLTIKEFQIYLNVDNKVKKEIRTVLKLMNTAISNSISNSNAFDTLFNQSKNAKIIIENIIVNGMGVTQFYYNKYIGKN